MGCNNIFRFSDGDFTFTDLIINETSEAHQFSVSCSDEDNVVSFGPEISDTFIIHQYCEQSQPAEIKIQSASCLPNDTSSACNSAVLSTNYGSTVQELVQFPNSLKAFLVDDMGNHIENPGTEPTAEGLCSVINPWEVSVSLSGGPGGASLTGTTTVPFSGGYADFSNLMVDTAGSGYSLEFSISYSSQGNAVPSLTLPFPDVEMRPLTFKLTSKPGLEKHGEAFDSPMVASLWDFVNDVKAPSDIVSKVGGVDCEVSLSTSGGSISGTTVVSMSGKFVH